MVTTDRRQAGFLSTRRPSLRRAVVGVDGGGTKTRAVILGADLEVLGDGFAGASNPLRVGIAGAAAAIREAIDRACEAAQLRRTDLIAAEIGLAGARRLELNARMREALLSLGIGEIVVVGDADIALFGATEGDPGLIVIAGTGSICCGINARRKTICAGGWGPIAGDEGAGAWIARRALRAIAHAVDGRGPATSLTSAACAYFHVSDPDDLATAIYAPSMTNERLAGFGKNVIEAAKAKDRVIVLHRVDPFIALADGSERMPSVFFKMSRCSRKWRFSRRAASNWPCRSASEPGLAPAAALPPASAGAKRFFQA